MSTRVYKGPNFIYKQLQKNHISSFEDGILTLILASLIKLNRSNEIKSSFTTNAKGKAIKDYPTQEEESTQEIATHTNIEPLPKNHMHG